MYTFFKNPNLNLWLKKIKKLSLLTAHYLPIDIC